MTGVITRAQMVADLRQIVERFGPDHVADDWNGSGCVYVEDGLPSCIVAQHLVNLGLATVEEMADWDARPGGTSATFSRVLRMDARHLKQRLEPEAVLLLQLEQEAQDRGENWGTVLQAVEDGTITELAASI